MYLTVHILVADDDLDRTIIHGRRCTRDHRIDGARLTRLDVADVAAGIIDGIRLKLRCDIIENHLAGVVDIEHHVGFTADVNAFGHHIVVRNRESCLLIDHDIQRHLLLGILEIRGVILFIDGQRIGPRVDTRFRHHIPCNFLRLPGREAVDDIGVRAVLGRQCRGLIHLFRLEGKQYVAGTDAGTCVLHLHHQLKRLSGKHLLRFGMIARHDESCFRTVVGIEIALTVGFIRGRVADMYVVGILLCLRDGRVRRLLIAHCEADRMVTALRILRDGHRVRSRDRLIRLHTGEAAVIVLLRHAEREAAVVDLSSGRRRRRIAGGCAAVSLIHLHDDIIERPTLLIPKVHGELYGSRIGTARGRLPLAEHEGLILRHAGRIRNRSEVLHIDIDELGTAETAVLPRRVVRHIIVHRDRDRIVAFLDIVPDLNIEGHLLILALLQRAEVLLLVHRRCADLERIGTTVHWIGKAQRRIIGTLRARLVAFIVRIMLQGLLLVVRIFIIRIRLF